jgi:hypothetical protein
MFDENLMTPDALFRESVVGLFPSLPQRAGRIVSIWLTRTRIGDQPGEKKETASSGPGI